MDRVWNCCTTIGSLRYGLEKLTWRSTRVILKPATLFVSRRSTASSARAATRPTRPSTLETSADPPGLSAVVTYDVEATKASFRDGWFHSGDIGVWHPDGYIELRDRKKDIIISGGENISTIEVEQCVARHPAVMECAVVAIPDEKWGERPKAFVTLKPGQSASEQEIIDFCKRHIAGFKAPAAVDFGELPKTSTGKIQKFVLRDREWKGKTKRIN